MILQNVKTHFKTFESEIIKWPSKKMSLFLVIEEIDDETFTEFSFCVC